MQQINFIASYTLTLYLVINMAKKEQFTEMDYIKAVRKADREREIKTYGKVISLMPTKVHKAKNAYNRSKSKNINFDDEF